MADDHPRINTREVCDLARYTTATLWRRIEAGIMPKPIDRGSGGYLFDRKAVLIALGMGEPAIPAVEAESWDLDPQAYRDALARDLRRRKGQGWRDRPKTLD